MVSNTDLANFSEFNKYYEAWVCLSKAHGCCRQILHPFHFIRTQIKYTSGFQLNFPIFIAIEREKIKMVGDFIRYEVNLSNMKQITHNQIKNVQTSRELFNKLTQFIGFNSKWEKTCRVTSKTDSLSLGQNVFYIFRFILRSLHWLTYHIRNSNFKLNCVCACIVSFILFNQLENGGTQMKIDKKQMTKKESKHLKPNIRSSQANSTIPDK